MRRPYANPVQQQSVPATDGTGHACTEYSSPSELHGWVRHRPSGRTLRLRMTSAPASSQGAHTSSAVPSAREFRILTDQLLHDVRHDVNPLGQSSQATVGDHAVAHSCRDAGCVKLRCREDCGLGCGASQEGFGTVLASLHVLRVAERALDRSDTPCSTWPLASAVGKPTDYGSESNATAPGGRVSRTSGSWCCRIDRLRFGIQHHKWGSGATDSSTPDRVGRGFKSR